MGLGLLEGSRIPAQNLITLVAVDYPISWDDESKSWSFVGHTFPCMEDLIELLRVEPLTSKWGGYDVFLLNPAPGGKKGNLEFDMFGWTVPQKEGVAPPTDELDFDEDFVEEDPAGEQLTSTA